MLHTEDCKAIVQKCVEITDVTSTQDKSNPEHSPFWDLKELAGETVYNDRYFVSKYWLQLFTYKISWSLKKKKVVTIFACQVHEDVLRGLIVMLTDEVTHNYKCMICLVEKSIGDSIS